MYIKPIFTLPVALLTIVLVLSIQAIGASIFDSPWRGFDTGVFGHGFAPTSFAVGDLDADGDIDVLVGDSFANSFDLSGTGIAVLKNKGDKTFSAPVFYGLGAGQTVGEVALSDIDLDGDLDAVATIRGNYDEMSSLRIWRNNGSGIFGSSVIYPTGEGPAGLVVRDFTGDGRPDIVTANYTGLSVSVLTHNGQTGSAAGFGPARDYPTNLRNEKIAFADINGDGRQDLAVGGQIPSTTDTKLAIMLNDGAGGFTASAAYESAPGSRFSSTAVALSDLDLDGDVDLIGGGLYSSGSTDSGAVTIRRNNGSGIFGSPETLLFDVFASQPKEISTGDLNGDGFSDIIAAIPSGRAVEGFETILSNGSGGFRTPVYNEASQQTFDVFPVDLDHDEDLDVITLANSSAAITVHENNGSGQFAVLPRYEVASLSDAVESADIDNDGDLDIVVNGEVDIASNDAVLKILKNNGNGTFVPAASYSPPRNFADMKLRDINGDGFVDIIFAPDGNYPNYHIGTALNLGNGTFAPTVVKQIFSCGEGTIDAADLDGDGDRDIVLTEEEGCQGGAPVRIFILRNDGGQNFTQMIDLHPAGLPHGLSLADVSG
ncbi:MAG TPA: VCBS repeat-containing protein, partial [Pyrinomonadaceae bacterium]|nr:VCBS repeat-containing protein [Pyrinomonadaceae bacterium]